ncbi:MAG: histone family protein [Candidatus Helarchaeota archaeon]
MSAEKKDRVLPIAPVDRLIRKANIKRVSEKAAVALAEILEEIGLEISKIAIDLAKHAHRKTVNDEDIKLAWKNMKRNMF